MPGTKQSIVNLSKKIIIKPESYFMRMRNGKRIWRHNPSFAAIFASELPRVELLRIMQIVVINILSLRIHTCKEVWTRLQTHSVCLKGFPQSHEIYKKHIEKLPNKIVPSSKQPTTSTRKHAVILCHECGRMRTRWVMNGLSRLLRTSEFWSLFPAKI